MKHKKKAFRAVDDHGRVVYFKHVALKLDNSVYFAYNQKGERKKYRVRHRYDGPAMISKNGVRRWFLEGKEYTKEIERMISPSVSDGDLYRVDSKYYELSDGVREMVTKYYDAMTLL